MKVNEYLYHHQLKTLHERQHQLDDDLAPNELLIIPKYVGICGSDLLEIENSNEELNLGHEWVGTVLRMGAEVEGFSIGDTVTSSAYISCGQCESCNRPFDTHRCQGITSLGKKQFGALRSAIVFPQHSLIRIEGEPLARSILYEVFSVGLEAYYLIKDDLALRGIKEVTILGAGPIGVSLALCLKQLGIPSLLIDRRATRVGWAKSMGLEAIPLAFAMIDPSFRNTRKCIVDCSSVSGGDPGALEHLSVFAAESSSILVIGKYRKTDAIPFCSLANRRVVLRFLSSVSLGRIEETMNQFKSLIDSIHQQYITHTFEIKDLPLAIDLALKKDHCGKIVIRL